MGKAAWCFHPYYQTCSGDDGQISKSRNFASYISHMTQTLQNFLRAKPQAAQNKTVPKFKERFYCIRAYIMAL